MAALDIVLALELSRSITVLDGWLGDDQFDKLLLELGLASGADLLRQDEVDAARRRLVSSAAGISASSLNLESAVADDDESLGRLLLIEITSRLPAFEAAFADLGGAAENAFSGTPFEGMFRPRLTAWRWARFLADYHGLSFFLARLLGLIDTEPNDITSAAPIYVLRLKRMLDWLTDPVSTFRSVLGADGHSSGPAQTLEHVADLAGYFGVVAGAMGGDSWRIGPVDASAGSSSDLVFQIRHDLVVGARTVPLGRHAEIVTSVSGDLSAGMSTRLTPQLALAPTIEDSNTPIFSTLIRYAPSLESEGRVVVEVPGLVRLDAEAIVLEVSADPDLSWRFWITDGELVPALVSSDDGFLRSVASRAGFNLDFSIEIAWSRASGLRFVGGSGLVLRLPTPMQLGPGGVQSVVLAAELRDTTVTLVLALDAGTSLGPLIVSIERMGVALEAGVFDGEASAPFGPADVSLGFLPPTGLGLAIDAGPVTGGGFLFFDQDRGEYAGAVELTVGKLGLQAVGLLNTVLPDGSDGFSLLVIISGEFPPVQLGFGFTLNAVGGLLGIHRSVDREALEAGFESRALDSIMFPENVVENAPRILADLRAIFPPVRDQYVFGPMAMLGWGTPPLLLAELAVVLELPSPLRLFVLGQFHAYLPSEEVEPRIAEIHMDVLGVIDFDRQEAAIDAALYDSRVSIYNLTGEMAMRLAWGGRPNFALSVGGLNPRFEPPPSFPVLDRLAVSLGSGKNPRISLGCYLALTSNSVQVGARLDIRASKLGFTVTGILGFDALFEFDPFRFQVDLYGMVDVSKGRRTLLQVRLELYLAGPSPWNAAGLAEFRALKLKVRVRFEVEFGRREDPPLPAVSPWDELKNELRDPRSWEAKLPAASSRLVTFGGAGRGNDTLVHPGGTLAVRQRVVPFGLQLERYGNAPPGDDDRFVLDKFALAENPQDEDFTSADPERAVMAYFAPAQFLEMSDDEKVSAPAFEHMQAGVHFGDEAMHEPATEARRLKVYRTVTIIVGGEATEDEDSPDETEARTAADRDADRATEQRDGVLASSAKAVRARRGAATASGRDRFRGPEPKTLGVEDVEYVIARVDTLELVDVAGQAADRSAGSGTYARVRQRLRAHVASHPELEGQLQIVGAHEVGAR